MENLDFLFAIFVDVDVFMLILVRVIGFFIILPIFSGANIPAIFRMLFAAAFAYMVFMTGVYTSDYIPIDNIMGMFTIVATEFLVGFIMAYVVYVVFTTLFVVGLFIDDAVGFKIVSVMDPMSQIQVPVAGNLLFMMSMAMMVITGGLNLLLVTMARSFEFVPIGFANVVDNVDLMMYLTTVITGTLAMGLQMAMPLLAVGLLVNVALGILVKSVPQMNMFVVGIPLRMSIGLIVFAMILPVYMGTYNILFDRALDAMINVIGFLAQG